jgi:hypothetical protein
MIPKCMMGLTGYVASMEENGGADNILVGNPEGRRLSGRPTRR